MTPSQACIDLIKKSEGFRAEPYKDAAGFATCGYGHKLVDAAETATTPWTEEYASQICQQDAQRACDEMAALVKVALTQGQIDALTDFVFNMGSGRLAESTLLKVLNFGEYQNVPNELRKWVMGGGVKLPGLVARREAEVTLWNQA